MVKVVMKGARLSTLAALIWTIKMYSPIDASSVHFSLSSGIDNHDGTD
jgi:hypothetical protein